MIFFFTKCNKTLIPKIYRHQLNSISTSFILISNFSTISTSSSSISRSVKEQNKSTFTDLLISCGCKPSSKLVSVVRFFKRFGFSDTQIKTGITKPPFLLSYNLSKNLKPKINFFGSIGLSQQDIFKIMTSYPHVFGRSLENTLIPLFDMLKHYYGGEKIAIDRIKQWPPLIRCGVCECLPQNVETLRDFGVPKKRIEKMVTGSSCCGICASTKPSYFKKIVGDVIDMGFDPSMSSFEKAVHVMAWHNEPSWRKKLKVYESLGFSGEEIRDMFKKQPISFGISERKIRAAANFYFEKFNWSPSQLVKNPNALLYSLEKRVVPRCYVLQVLALRNKVKNVYIITLLTKTENEFLKKYVNSYKDEIPEVLDAYQGKIKFDDFNFDLK